MIDQNIESFLEKTDMNYMFCLLSKLEAQRISQLPVYVRNRFAEKIPVMAMQHVAANEVPDYIAEIAEAELAMQQQASPFDEDEGELGEETYDDSERFIEELEQDSLDKYDDDEDEDDEFFLDNGDDSDDED
jgi:hypothetical protein